MTEHKEKKDETILQRTDNMQQQDSISLASSLSDSCCTSNLPKNKPQLLTSIDFADNRIKAEYLSVGGTEDSGTNEGIEVEAIEFDKSAHEHSVLGFPCIKKLMLFIVAFLVIVVGSAITGFLVLGSKRMSRSAPAISSLNSTNNTERGGNVTDFNGTVGSLNPIDSDLEQAIGSEYLRGFDTDALSVSQSPSPTSIPTLSPTLAPSSNPSEITTTDLTQVVTSQFTSGLMPPWNDSPCVDHSLIVSSTCTAGSAYAFSKALFRLASKRDGDWYWVRNNNSEDSITADYDSWDYMEETEGELTFSDLSSGNYIISLVRDSMQPYDEIISQEFSVPECN